MKYGGMDEMSAETRPPAPPASPIKAMSADEDCVPLASLAMPDEADGDQMANPEVGDKVNYQVEGTVTRVENGNAYVKRESVNGQPVEGADDEGASDEDSQDAQDESERGELGNIAGGMGGLS